MDDSSPGLCTSSTTNNDVFVDSMSITMASSHLSNSENMGAGQTQASKLAFAEDVDLRFLDQVFHSSNEETNPLEESVDEQLLFKKIALTVGTCDADENLDLGKESSNQQEVLEFSSLSLVDFDAMDDYYLFEVEDLASADIRITPSRRKDFMMSQDDVQQCSSPILRAAGDGACVQETPAHIQQELINRSNEKQENHPSASTASPIKLDGVVSSTPFLNRSYSTCFKSDEKQTVNTTFNLKECGTKADRRTTYVTADMTYDGKSCANSTFSAPLKSSEHNGTFNKVHPDKACSLKANETFEVVVSSITETKRKHPSELSPAKSEPQSPFSKGAAAKTKINKGATTKNERRPLSALNNTTKLKPVMTVQQKRVSRLQAPRMNAAALSRIQARSPINREEQDENTASTTKQPTAAARKPPSKNQALATRKCLLPPSSGKVRLSPGGDVNKVSSSPRNGTAKVTKAQSSTTRKRKIDKDSPKHQATGARTAKADTTFSKLSASKVTSRISLLNSRPSTKSQKTAAAASGISRLPTSVVATDGATATARYHTAVQKQTQAAGKNEITSKSLNVKEKRRIIVSPTSQCVVALATLLDYVVNRLDGLSAPKLSANNQQLEQLVKEKSDRSDDLSSRVADLETWLKESRDARERDIESARIEREQETRKLREIHQRKEEEFRERLEETTTLLHKQEIDHKTAIDELQSEHEKSSEDLIAKYEETMTELRHQWSEEKEEMERETQALRESMDAQIETKVEELIQPYINSYEENKSLRAVLEMKNSEQHKLHIEISQQNEQLDEARSLRDQLVSVQQRNEDLQTQVHEKNYEYRQLNGELLNLRRELNEQQNANKTQLQRLEELSYRLDASSPSPASPFNPVFTPSPTSCPPSSGSGLFPATTPRSKKQNRFLRNDPSSTPHRRSRSGDDVTMTPRENGMT